MKILLSIKPKYVEKIMSKKKRFEYRKSNMKNIKNNDIKEVVIYSTLPIGKIVGHFEIKRILEGSPKKIWEETKEYSGLEKKEYEEYYKNKKECFVIEIGKIKKYKTPLKLREYDNKIKVAPQSFVYLND